MCYYDTKTMTNQPTQKRSCTELFSCVW